MQTVISKDGTRIAFDKRGQGPALILVGGAFQYRSFDQSTAHLAEMLAKDFTTYHYDRRGRGDSTDTKPYAKEREIEDIAALIVKAGGAAYVFGMSSGAAVALDAAQAGLTILKLALYEPPFVVDGSRPPVPDDYIAKLNAFIAKGQRAEAVEYFMEQAVSVPHDVVAGMRQAPFWPAFEAVAHTIAYDGAFVADLMRGKPLPAKRWAKITVPTLVMDGGNSPDWMRNAAPALSAILKKGSHETLQGQTHDISPEVLAPKLVNFFQQ